MSGRDDERLRRLREALRDVAEEDLPHVIEDARAGARAKATEIVEAALRRRDRRAGCCASRRAPDAGGRRRGRDGLVGVRRRGGGRRARRSPRECPACSPAPPSSAWCDGDLAALVSRVPLTDFGDERLREHLNDLDWVERTARAHEGALEAALSARDGGAAAAVHDLPRRGRGRGHARAATATQLAEAVERLRGRSEWGVKVFASRERLAEAARVADGARSAGDSEGARSTYSASARSARSASASTTWPPRARASATPGSEQVAASARVNPPQRREAHGRDADMVLNGVYLIPDDGRDRLRRRGRRAARRVRAARLRARADRALAALQLRDRDGASER